MTAWQAERHGFASVAAGAAARHRGRAAAATGSTFYRAALAVAAVAVLFTNASLYLSNRTGGLVIPLYWLVAFAAAAGGLVLARRPSAPLHVAPIHVWAYGYALVTILWFVPFAEKSAAATQNLIDRLLAAVTLLILAILFADAGAQRAARVAVAFAVLFAAGVNLYEVANPGIFSTDVGRAAGLYGNANQSAAALVLGMICAQGALPPGLRRPFALVAGLGVLATFSRSGLIGWVVVFAALQLPRGRRLRGLLVLGVVGALVVGFVASPWWTELLGYLEQRGTLTAEVRDRLAFFGGERVADPSSAAREAQALAAWRMFEADPLVGAGTGAAYEPPFAVIGPHNTYLAMMVDHGVWGAVILPLLVAATIWGARGEARPVAAQFALFVLFWGLFSHNALEEPYILISFALVASIVQASRRPTRTDARRAPPASPARGSPVVAAGGAATP